MPREGLTEIVCILDKSGSMASVKNDAIGGFNTFIKDQKSVAGEATLSLIMFAAGYSIIYEGKNIKDAPDLDDKTFIPGGSTALLRSEVHTSELQSHLNLVCSLLLS